MKVISLLRRGHRLNILGILLAGFLFMVGKYQEEIMWIQKAWEWSGFMLPFGFIVPWYVARDIWYALEIGAFFLLFFSLWFWED